MRTRLAAALTILPVLAACGGATSRHVLLGNRPVDPARLTPVEVAGEVAVNTRGEDTIYRAPTLASFQDLDLTHGTSTLGRNLGTVRAGRQGFLFGVRKPGQPVRSYVAFQSNLIDGTGRYASVTLADGTALPIRTTKSNQARCEPDCVLVFETVVVEVPDGSLRAVPAGGLVIDYHLDNGAVTRVTAPAAYVRGYLQAVDSPR